jgi:hypothetical protein
MNPIPFILLQFICLISISQNTLNVVLNMNPEDRYIYEVIDVSDTEQLVMGEEQQIKQTDMYSLILNVDSVLSDKSIHFKATYKHFRSEFESDNYREYFDTDSLYSTDNPEANYYKSLIGKSFYFHVNKKGRVLSFLGLDSVFKAEKDIEIDTSSVKMLQKKFGRESIQNILFAFKYSSTDTTEYSASDTIPSGILNIYNRQFSFVKEALESNEIKYSAVIFTDSEKSMKIGNVYISYEMGGKLSGIIETDKTSNFTKKVHYKQFISGSAGMKYSINSDHAYTWPIKITNTITGTVAKITTP